MDKLDIEKVVRKNPAVDTAQLCELLKVLQELQNSAAVPCAESDIVPPYTRPTPVRRENQGEDPRTYRLRQNF